jgi:hypothetical protein
MAITRQQSKKMNSKTDPAHHTPPNHAEKHKHGIDFIEASKEWRKNKVKLDNGTFDYILL